MINDCIVYFVSTPEVAKAFRKVEGNSFSTRKLFFSKGFYFKHTLTSILVDFAPFSKIPLLSELIMSGFNL